jgi:P4 family phage/plasmid primase-like protien
MMVRPSEPGIVAHLVSTFETEGPLVIHTEGAFQVWTGTHWRRASQRETHAWVHRYDGMPWGRGTLSLTSAKIRSILALLAVELSAPGFFDERPLGMNAANGFVDLSRGTPRLEPHDPRHAQDFVLAGRWVEGRVESDLLRALVEGCFRDAPDARRRAVLLMELAGAIATGIGTRLRDPAAFVFVGDGANGKSQLLDALQGLVPPEAVSSVPVTDFGHDRYRVQLAGKRLNLAAELGVSRAIASDKFKAIISGDAISAREIREAVMTFRPRAVHVFAANTLPAFDAGMPMSVTRRLIVVPFTRVIPKDERIAEIGKRVASEEADALVSYAVRGAVRLLRRGRYTVPRTSRRAAAEWVEEADIIEAFAADGWVRHSPGKVRSSAEVYAAFRAYAGTQGVTRLPAVKEFVRRLVSSGRGFGRKRTSSQRFITNIELTPPPTA